MQKLACIVYSALNISLNICWLTKLFEKKQKMTLKGIGYLDIMVIYIFVMYIL